MKQQITGILLTGGKSTRMGQDKANVPHLSKPLAQWSLEALTPLCNAIIVASNNGEHKKFGDLLVYDAANINGPLAGLTAALKASKTEINIVLACDTPNITTSILQKLLHELNGYDAVVLVSANGRVHPLIGCYRTNVLSTISEIIKTDRHSIMHLLDNMKVKQVIAHDDSVTLNVNSIKELK